MAEYEEQKKVKPAFSELIEICTDSDMKAAAEGFVAFLNENKLKPQWGAKNSYNVKFKSRNVCIIKINENGFELRICTQYNEDFDKCFEDAESRIKKFLYDTVTYCSGCGTCKPGLDIELLGHKLQGACFNPVIRLENPDGELIGLSKKLVLLRKKAISEGSAPRVTYISKNKRDS